jgi:hypothetical protein
MSNVIINKSKMENFTEKLNNGFSSNVERGDNMPIVVSQYGFKEEKIDGKTYLVAMNKDEYIECLNNLSGISKEDLNDLISRVIEDKANCSLFTTMSCITRDNCQWCVFESSTTYHFCYCRNTP